MFKQVPKFQEHLDDPVSYLLSEMDKHGIAMAMVGTSFKNEQAQRPGATAVARFGGCHGGNVVAHGIADQPRAIVVLQAASLRERRADARHTAQHQAAGNSCIAHQGLQDRRRIREPAGFDDDAIELGKRATVAAAEHVIERPRQVAADFAAQASGLQLDKTVVARLDEIVIEADPARLSAQSLSATDLVNALREQKLLTVGAGENVVRFLPPLIVTEAEIEESVARLERACAALSGGQLKRAAGQ